MLPWRYAHRSTCPNPYPAGLCELLKSKEKFGYCGGVQLGHMLLWSDKKNQNHQNAVVDGALSQIHLGAYSTATDPQLNLGTASLWGERRGKEEEGMGEKGRGNVWKPVTYCAPPASEPSLWYCCIRGD